MNKTCVTCGHAASFHNDDLAFLLPLGSCKYLIPCRDDVLPAMSEYKRCTCLKFVDAEIPMGEVVGYGTSGSLSEDIP